MVENWKAKLRSSIRDVRPYAEVIFTFSKPPGASSAVNARVALIGFSGDQQKPISKCLCDGKQNTGRRSGTIFQQRGGVKVKNQVL